MKLRSPIIAVTLLIVLSGCSTIKATDPFEPVNRQVFKFNDTVDQYAIKPVAQGYKAVVPDPVRTAVGNFFSNLGDVWSGVNNLLQAKPGAAAESFFRFAFNSTFGILGFIDIASEAGIEKHKEDFGQTLGRWGVPAGPYLILPIFGPSTLRDAPSLVVDISADPVSNVNDIAWRNSLTATRLVDLRASILDAEKVINEASLDKYSFVRNAWLQRRQNQVYDGNPPRLKRDDDGDE